MEDLIKSQSKIISALQQLWSNFKKDSEVRKTPDYIKRKLETFDMYWSEFHRNHELMQQYEDQTSEYFVKGHYEETKVFYDSVRQSIMKCMAPQPSSSPKPPSSSSPDQKLKELLRKQTTNIKAFSRTLSNITVENIKEKWEYEDTLKTIEMRWATVDKTHWEIENELGDTRNEEYEVYFNAHEANYIRIKKEINSRLWSVSHRETSTPKLDIPEFNGNYQQWASFKDLFTEAIHENPCLSNAQKMQFLKSKIKGEPERLIQHLQIGSDNYLTCWDILNHRYNNKKLIFSTYMNTLMALPVIQQATTNYLKRMHDVTQECLNGIKNLGVDISTWDPIIVHILSQKLDADTHSDYLESLKHPRELPSLTDFLQFLEGKFTALEASRRKQENVTQKQTYFPMTSSSSRPNNNPRPSFPPKKYFSSYKISSKSAHGSRITCPVCQEDHGIYFCKQFEEMTPTLKRSTIEKSNLCSNCLYNHTGKGCNSNKRCRLCNGYHNTLLHDAFSKQTNTYNRTSVASPQRPSASHVAQQQEDTEVLLATAMIKVQGSDGVLRHMRALIDQGSQVSLISENAAQQLKLQRQKCKGVITGVGINNNVCKGLITMKCKSLSGSHAFTSDAYIMKSLTRNLPSYTIPKPSWAILENIELADPEFYISKQIDVLLGADIYSNIIMEGIHKQESSAVLQETKLGWILCGKVQSPLCNVIMNNIEQIQKFWEIEDISDNNCLTEEEQECIVFYKSTTTRLENGKYEVRLPLKSTCDTNLGKSKGTAIAQFKQLERKFNKNDIIAKQYKAFIEEYLSLGHMTPAHSNNKPDYYMPHHCVLREDSTTTALRVVFNGSQPTSNGTSLNDVMHTGPNLQADLLCLILKWRQHKIAFIADIEKMFRQIWIQECDQHYQKILWRDAPHQLLREYQLTTVTYGTKAAPFLAMMTLQQLAYDERHRFPEAAKVVQECFYMDDLLHGSHSIEAAKSLQQNLIELMQTGGFNLRKWMSNSNVLVHDNKVEYQENELYDFKQAESTKTLGLHWDPQQDTFFFQCKIESSNEDTITTKRKLLSEISKLFDPLGWLTPISTKLKSLFQTLWKTHIEWDDKLPEDINKEWTKIKQEINLINNFTIPRWINTLAASDIELHGYCDASLKAYACVIYCKTINEGQTRVHLLSGKSKLVPHNKEITLPRLELSGAELLSKLMKKVMQSLSNHNIKVYGWTDSTAVLGWLQGNPDSWKVFVSRRVRSIIEIIPSHCWRYVKSGDNPADCASRGTTPSQLSKHELWWQGPQSLTTSVPTKQEQYTTTEEIKSNKQVNLITQYCPQKSEVLDTLLTRCSSFSKVVRVLAWVRRYITRKQDRKHEKYITLSELRQASTMIVKHVQQSEYQDEINSLKENKRVSNKSKLLNLHPYLDSKEVLRVGGRLQHAHIHPDMKNPIILPHANRLTELIITQAHKLTYHGGARVTLAFTRRKYWIVGGNNATKKTIRRCVTCKRQNPYKHHQIMGDLPEARVIQSRPFSHTGVDFTGHIYVKANKGRGIKTTKGYVAVFVCMVTKAVHLELVSDLTTSALLAAVRRMSARRGTPQHMYSDNGRNFVGANNVLQKEYQELLHSFNDEFIAELTNMEIKWHFNAPAWPSAGGLWEAAVKSFKHHFKRVIGEQKLTFEELTTLLTQIEACLNSRPLCALSEDPEDLDFLSPSHFLTGGSALTLVETEHDLRTRWQLTQKILHDLWNRWRTEYLTQLNTRSKWKQPQKNINIGDIVLIHDDNLPPGKWALGRVIELHPGTDKNVRVVTLKTKSGYMKRPIIKLSMLLDSEADVTKDDSKNKDSTRNPTPTRKVSKKFSFTSLATALMLFFTFISSSQAYVSINQFKQNQSLYFDKISDMMLIKDEWKLVVYYNMKPYWQANQAFTTYLSSLRDTCDVIKEQVHCDVIQHQLQQDFSELEYYNQMLLSQHSKARPARQSRRRRRRGLINGVGYMANSLFGVLDQSFAEQYRKDITLLQDNQDHLAQLWKNQTSIIEAEFNLLKRTEQTMNKQHKLIHEHILDLEVAIDSIKNNVEKSYIMSDYNTGGIIANNLLQNLKSIQNRLLDMITDIYHGRFNLHLLTPEQLTNELSIISTKLPKDVSLPIDNIHTELRKIYELLQVKTRMLEDILIFEIKIPLINRDTYELMQVTPVPKQVGTHMVSIIPISDFIAINMRKDSYILMSELDVKACLTISESYLCYLHKPIYQLREDKNLCETQTTTCKTITKSCKNIWQETNTINTFMYFCCERCPVRIMCDDQVTAQQLTHAGLVNIGNGCLIKTDDFTIFAHKVYSSEMKMKTEIQAPVMAPINHVINLTISHSQQDLKETSAIPQDMLQLQERIERLREVEPIAHKISYHDIHHYTMIYIILSLLGIVLLIFVVKWCKCQKCTWRVPQMNTRAPPAAAAPRPEDASPPPRDLPPLPRRSTLPHLPRLREERTDLFTL